ncbi:hypothetical protein [Actinomadura darangshiensis]|nr:hypothetical protein [Actinomadura darangshiensis]
MAPPGAGNRPGCSATPGCGAWWTSAPRPAAVLVYDGVAGDGGA